MFKKKLRILIVEDDPYQQSLYARFLDNGSTEIEQARSGPDSLEFDWTQFDVVMLDFLMPGMNGGEVLNIAAKRYGDDMPPVVVFTALSKESISHLAGTLPGPRTEIYQKAGQRTSVLASITDAINHAAHNRPTVRP